MLRFVSIGTYRACTSALWDTSNDKIKNIYLGNSEKHFRHSFFLRTLQLCIFQLHLHMYTSAYGYRYLGAYLWPPCIITQAIYIFVLSFVMVALCNRADHYIFALWFLSSFFFFSFPRLISAVAEWMSSILPHMVWPQCEFRMHVGNVLQAARWKYRTQKKSPKIATWAQSYNVSGYIYATKARIDNQKKLVKQQYLLYMSS